VPAEQAKFPLRPEFPVSSSTCRLPGNVGRVPVRLLEPSNNCVSPVKDDMALGIEPVSEVDVRSTVCRDPASAGDVVSDERGEGERGCELTSRFCSPVSPVRLLGRVEPICELRTSARVVSCVRPGEVNNESGSAVMEVASR